MQRSHRTATRNRLVGLGLLVVLIVGMVLNTKFLSPEELAAALPKPFDPQQTAADLFERAKSELPASAKPLGEVLAAVRQDPKAAAQQFGAAAPNESTFVFPVTAIGTVTQASAQSLRLSVPGAPEQTPVLVPLGTAINGTVIRDAMGFKFADAPGQTDYQYVGDELKKLMQTEISSGVADPAALEGKQVTVVGAISVPNTGSPPPAAKPVNVQAISVLAGS